jgi:hypothetical protein
MPIQRIPLNFSVESNEYDEKQLSAQTCKNWYGIVDDSGLFSTPLKPFPGSRLWSDDTSSNCVRGMYQLNNVLYAVIDDKFRIYNADGGYTNVGTLHTSEGRVTFMANDNQIFLSDVENGYVYQLITTTSRSAGDFFRIQNASSIIETPARFTGSGVNDLSPSGTYVGSTDLNYRVEIDGQNKSSFSAVAFYGTGPNDMALTGSYTGTLTQQYKVEIDGQTTAFFGDIVFVGSGVNDMTLSGTYTGGSDKTYRVKIDSIGATDTFTWSNDDGATWHGALTPITAANQLLENGISVKFNAKSGHTANDYWQFTANIARTDDTFRWSNDNGITWKAQHVKITGTTQSLESGVSISFKTTSGHKGNDYWSFTAYSAGSADTFKWSDDGGKSFLVTGVPITGAAQLLNYGIEITFQHQTGHTTNDYWDFNVSIDDAFYPPLVPTYLNTYGIYPKHNTKRFYVTGLDDFSSINSLAYAQANAFPDNLVVGIAINGEVIMFCDTTIEFWYPVGGEFFPLERRPNILLNYGCVAPYSLAVAGNNILFWLGQNANGGRFVMRMESYVPAIISSASINSKLSKYTKTDNAFGFVVEWQGSVFYFLTFPDEDITWVWDDSTKKWYQRTTRYKPDNISSREYIEGRYLANCHVYFNGEHYIGDYRSGNIYKMDKDYYRDGQELIICEATTPPLNIKLDRTSIYFLQISLQAATSLTSGQGSDATVMLQYSKDGGYTWNKEISRTLGKVGEYLKRVKWNKLSYARDHVFRIRISDPVYRVLFGAVLELEDSDD